MFRLVFIAVVLLPIMLFAVKRGVGFVVEYTGEVHVYRNPGIKTSKVKRVNMVKYEGKKKQHFRALKYEKLFTGDIIRTGKSSKAKIILKNKNVIFVNEYGKLKLPEPSSSGKDENIFGLVFGKVRGIVVKSRSEKKSVSTPAAVMGIRGTDFVMGYSPYRNKTEVSVLRGEVSLKKKTKAEIKKEIAKEKEVKSEKEISEKVPEKEEEAQIPSEKVETVIVKAGYTAAVKVKMPELSKLVGDELKKGISAEKKPVEKPDKKDKSLAEEDKTVKPRKITLDKLDEAKLIAMVVPEEKKKGKEKAPAETRVIEENKEEAIESIKKADIEVTRDIMKDVINQKSKSKVKPEEVKKEGKVNINASLDSILDKRLNEEGVDAVAYRKVPVQARVKARQAGLKERELTPRHIREKSKTDPEVKSIFDSFVEFF